MAKGLDYLKDAIKWYENRFCVCFTPAVIYALYPKEGEYGWPHPWPISDSAGIYAFLDSNKTIVYIGKAGKMGARLNHYFGYGKNDKCILKDERIHDISYVQCYSCSPKEPYACLSLEEYLISKMNPKYNKIGRTEW
jgi:hypothetical protein